MPYGIYEDGKVIAQFVVPMTVRNNRPTFISDSMSLKRGGKRRTAQRWEIETRVDPKQFDAQDLFVNLVVNGYTNLVTVITPQNTGVIARRTSTATPTATGLKGASSVAVTGNVGLISKGTFIRFANHSKVYMTVNDRTGDGPLTVYPELRADVAAVVFKHRDDVIMNCKYDTDTIIGMSYEDGILMDNGIIKLVENI